MTPTVPSNSVLLERVEALRCDVVEMNKALTQFITETHNFRVSYTQGHENVVRRVTVLETQQEETNEKIEAIAKDIAKMLPVYKGALWLAAIMGASIVALIWSIITHQVSLTF